MGDPATQARSAARSLDRCLCSLILRGHAQILSYPWPLYLAALDAANAEK